AEPVLDAIKDARARGVAVRLAYNVDHAQPIPVPPPPRTDLDLVARAGVAAKPIAGVPHLMHQKYVVRDGSDVWTGSMNWTDDSWTREENVVVTLASEAIAGAYARDFDDLWSGGTVQGSGAFDAPSTVVNGL